MNLSRRRFIESGALVIGFSLVPQAVLSQAAPATLPGSLNRNRMLNAWLRIDANGVVTIFSGKIGSARASHGDREIAARARVILRAIEVIHATPR